MATFLEMLKDDMVLAGEGTKYADGTTLRNSHSNGAAQMRIASVAGITAALAGHNQYFVNNFSACVPWLLVYAAEGHTSTNTCVEVSRMFCQVLKADNTWEFAFVDLPVFGKRVYHSDDTGLGTGTQDQRLGGVLRIMPSGGEGYELWPAIWDGSIGTVFYGKVDRSLFSQMKAFCIGVRVRLALINTSGTDDRTDSRFITQIGSDLYASPSPGMRYITDAGVQTNTLGAGYPYRVFDANTSRWKIIQPGAWQWVTQTTVSGWWGYEADLQPPWGNYTTKWPWNKSPSYAITESQIQSNPPKDPDASYQSAKRLVAVGTSSIDLWSTLAADFPTYIVENSGVSGALASSFIADVDSLVIQHNPDAVLVYVGENDIASAIAPATVATSVQTFVTAILADLPSAKIFVMSIKPSPSRWTWWDEMQTCNAALEAYCGTDVRLTYIDVSTPLLVSGAPYDPYYQSDDLHLSTAGYQVWASVIKPVVDAAFIEIPFNSSTVTPMEEYWDTVLPETSDVDRADALAALLASGTKLKLYANGVLLRTITTGAWSRLSATVSGYPIVPGAFTDPTTGEGTPDAVHITTSADVEIVRGTVGVAGLSEGQVMLPEPLSAGKAIVKGSLLFLYPSGDGVTPPVSGKRWYPGHYFYASQDSLHTVTMKETRRNKVKTNPYFAGYYLLPWWPEMESTQGNYDFSKVLTELDKADGDGKKVWLRIEERSFHGATRGLPCPQYIADGGGTYADTSAGRNILAPKFWVPWVGQAYLAMVAAMMEAIDDHPALAGVATEECSISGAWLQPDWTWQKMNAFILEYCRVGSEGAVNTLWHQNMGWSNESSSDTAEHYRMTDAVVRTYKAGISPTDLRLTDSGATLSTTYGKYIFTRYAGETFFHPTVEYTTYLRPDLPKALIDFAVDQLGCQFISWSNTDYSASWTFTDDDAIAEVTRQEGRIVTTRPSNVPA